MCAQSLGHIQLFATPWTVAPEVFLSKGFSSPGDFPDPGIKPKCLMSPVLAGGFFTTSTTWEAQQIYSTVYKSDQEQGPTV